MAQCLKCDAELFDGAGRCPFCGAHEEGDAHIGSEATPLPEGEGPLTQDELDEIFGDEKEPKGSPEPEQADAQAGGDSNAPADHPEDPKEAA